jgi:hypothetical protein
VTEPSKPTAAASTWLDRQTWTASKSVDDNMGTAAAAEDDDSHIVQYQTAKLYTYVCSAKKYFYRYYSTLLCTHILEPQ